MLEGFRILDLTDSRGFLAGKILGDLGADVIKIEPPGGDPARRDGPFLGGIEDPERSLKWLALNTSKRSITIDLSTDEGRTLFRRLAATADAVVETAEPGSLDAAGIGWGLLRDECPRLVWCSITPFGSTGPRAHYRGGDLIVVAMGGTAALTGEPTRTPLRCTMPTSTYHAAGEAALGVVMALYAREQSGRGTHVDISMQECQVASLLAAAGTYGALGVRASRSGSRIGRTREIWRAADGFITFGLRAGPSRSASLEALVAYMKESRQCPDWLAEYDWGAFNHNNLDDDEASKLEEAFATFFRSRSRRELFEQALARRILLAPCNDAEQTLGHPQLRARDFFVTLDYPELGASIEHPAFFAKSSRETLRVSRRAPRIGQHSGEIRAQLGLPSRSTATPTRQP